MRRERREESVAAATVDRAHPAQMTIQLAAGEHVREGELIERPGTHVGGDLCRSPALHESVRQDEPAETKARCEDLARGSGVHHAIRPEPLERPDRLAV